MARVLLVLVLVAPFIYPGQGRKQLAGRRIFLAVGGKRPSIPRGKQETVKAGNTGSAGS
jgi:hypothetical protein